MNGQVVHKNSVQSSAASRATGSAFIFSMGLVR